MAQKQHSSGAILFITIVVALLLIVVIWPLAKLGKGGAAVGSSDDADV